MSTELDALMLANALEVSDKHPELINVNNRAAAELRRLHAENKRLETLCYDYLGELTALRAAEQMRKQTFMAKYKFRTYGYYQDADGKMQVGEIPEEMLTVSVEELIEKAVLAEREACADIAENWRCNGCPRTVLADQIRARGQE
jgi:SHS2 domain-containing protein